MTGITQLTVLLPAYNAEATLEQTLQSLQAQTWREFKVLLLDDGSTDRTPDIATRWASRDSRFVHVRMPDNQGVIATLNRGLELAPTDWIARHDADDLSDVRRLEWQVNALRGDAETVVLSTQGRFFGAQDRLHPMPLTSAAVKARIVFETPVLHAAAVMNAAWLRAHGIRYRSDYPLAEDYDLWSQVFRAGGQMRSIPQFAYAVRIHEASVSRRLYQRQMATAARISAELFDFVGCPLHADELALVRDHPFEGSMKPTKQILAMMRELNARIAKDMEPLLGAADSELSRVERGRFFAKRFPKPASRADLARLAVALARIDPAMAATFVASQLQGVAFWSRTAQSVNDARRSLKVR